MGSTKRITSEQIRKASRDVLLMRILQGVTKAVVHTDRRKEQSRRVCRKSLRRDGE